MEHLLFEHISGFELFELKSFEDLACKSFLDYMSLTEVISHVSTYRFDNTNQILSYLAFDDQNSRCMVDSEAHNSSVDASALFPPLRAFLELNSVKVLHADKSLKSFCKLAHIVYKFSPNISRGIRYNLYKLLKKPLDKQLLLASAHSYSKSKIGVQRDDSYAVFAGYEVEQLEREIDWLESQLDSKLNLFMPFLSNKFHSRGILVSKSDITEMILRDSNGEYKENQRDSLGKSSGTDSLCTHPTPIQAGSQNVSAGSNGQNCLNSTIHSACIREMLQNIPEIEKLEIIRIDSMLKEKIEIRRNVQERFVDKMKAVVPNTREVIGDSISVKMLHKMGGLTNLSMAPASTIQLLGAEKSLFRSLKNSKMKTPKHGILYDVFEENGLKAVSYKGRMSRFIASKVAIAAKIDCYGNSNANTFGKELRKLCEKRVKSLKTGEFVESTGELLERINRRITQENSKSTTTNRLSKEKSVGSTDSRGSEEYFKEGSAEESSGKMGSKKNAGSTGKHHPTNKTLGKPGKAKRQKKK